MYDESNSRKSLIAEQYLRSAIAGLGAFESGGDREEEFQLVAASMDRERASIAEKYPDKWAAVGRDGLLAVSSSLVEVLAEVKSRGLRGSEFVVEFLDSEPREDLIL